MNDFEKAVEEVSDNYTGETTQENAIEWIRGNKIATVTFANNTKQKTQVLNYAESDPDDVQIVAQNKDGSIVAHVPVKWINVRRPKKVVLSEERKQILREQIKNVRK